MPFAMTAVMSEATAISRACLHCGTEVPTESRSSDFCCSGCEAVYGLLRSEGLTRYYDLAAGETAPVADKPRERSWTWLEPLLERTEAQSGAICNLELDVQGVHCAACVWLMNELFSRQEGGARLVVNPALGKVQIGWKRGVFDLRRFLSEVERFGYLFGPSRKRTNEASRSLLLRLGITVALAMNVMSFSVAFYFGLAPEEETVFRLFTQLSLLLSSLVVVVGGWPFLKSAWRALQRGVLHLDLPIAVGILLAYGLSLWQIRDGRGDLVYFDTLNVFVTLMLTGRWVQERVLEKNRRFLLEDDGADGIRVRRLLPADGGMETVPAPKVRAGDRLVVAPGDLVPVDALLSGESGSFSTDWITGEPGAQQMVRGETVPAGAFNAGGGAVEVVATTDFADSPLPALLRTTAPVDEHTRAHTRFWDRLARIYVTVVLSVAALGLWIWWPTSPEKALQVTVALLVVTCPCAIGIAIPLAYELVQARLRRAGFFVRKQSFLDKLPRVRKVLFDKTGTLTLGELVLAEPALVDTLDASARDAAFDMASRSNHPVSRCIAAALEKVGAHFDPAAQVVEHPGKGLELVRDGRTWRLGKASWAAPDHAGHVGTLLACDGEPAASFRTTERVRADARRAIATLTEAGKEVWLVSGDAPDKVADMAQRLGVRADRALGGQRPEEKAALVDRLDRDDTLFLGDGVNDSLAFERALCAGTPAVERPVLPAKADFFLLGERIGGLHEAMALSQKLRVVVRRNLVVAVAYNLLTVSLSLAGWMTPVMAAVLMPMSSLSVLLVTITSLQAARKPRERRQPVAREVPA